MCDPRVPVNQCVCVMFQVQNPSWVPHQPYILQHPVRERSLCLLIIIKFITTTVYLSLFTYIMRKNLSVVVT